MKKFTAKINVRSYELDSFGHVNNATFLNYLEAARSDYLEEMGLSFNDFAKWQAFPVIARHEINYKSPAYFGDELSIVGYIDNIGKSSITFFYDMVNQNNRHVISASTTMVFVNSAGKPIGFPEPFRLRMAEYQECSSTDQNSN